MANSELRFRNPIEKHLSVLSRYQYFLFSLVFLCNVPVCWHIMSLLFLTPRINFYCNNTDVNVSTPLNHCPCEDPWWDRSVFAETLQTKFNIHCQSVWLIGFSHSMMYFGCLAGAMLFGFLSDKFGRLAMFSLSVFIVGIFGCLVVLMPTMESCTLMRFLEGIGLGGAVVTGYVLCVEYCGYRHREIVTTLFHAPYNIGHMTLAGASYIFRDCDDFQLAISIPLFLFVGLNWCVMESPKWLMDNHHINSAAYVMEKLSKFNDTSVGEIKAEIEEYLTSKASNTERKTQFWHIFYHKKLTGNFLCMAVNYFVCGFGFYGVSQYIGQMSGDIHLNVVVAGALLLVGTTAATFLIPILNRKSFLIACNFLSGLLMFTVVMIPSKYNWLRVIIACFCNSFFSMAFIVIFLYGVELFPTSVRNSVLGFLSVVSRLGQMVAPLVNQLPQTMSGSIFSGLAIIAGLLCIPLPETKHVDLPSSLEDSKTLSRRRKPNSQRET